MSTEPKQRDGAWTQEHGERAKGRGADWTEERGSLRPSDEGRRRAKAPGGERAEIVSTAVHAEWTKLRTVPSTGWLLLTAIVLTVGFSTLETVAVKCPTSCTDDTTKISLTGILVGQAVVAVLAVLVMTGEYSSGMIRITLAAVPRRITALAAKAIVLTGVVLVTGAIAVAGSVLAGRYILPGNGFTGAHGSLALSLGAGSTLRAAAGSVLYLALVALLSLGLATALRDSGVAITVLLGLLYIVPLLTDLGALDSHWERRFQQWGPMTAGLAIQATRNLKSLPIGPWPGLGVLALWAAGALLAGGLLLRLRDA
jgi:ABC-2 type transport system permease protein